MTQPANANTVAATNTFNTWLSEFNKVIAGTNQTYRDVGNVESLLSEAADVFSNMPDGDYPSLTEALLQLNDAGFVVDYDNGNIWAGNEEETTGKSFTGTSNNTGFGSNTVSALTTGSRNSVFGAYSLDEATDTVNSIAVGYASLAKSTTGDNNIAVGANAMSATTAAGDDNIAIGNKALNVNTGDNNIVVGHRSAILLSDSGANDNIVIGNDAFATIVGTSQCDYNIAIGGGTLANTTNAFSNVAVGRYAMQNGSNATSCVAVGNSALAGHVTSDGGWNNIAIGYGCLSNSYFSIGSTGQNVGIGSHALENTADGQNNIALGNACLQYSGAAQACIAIGPQSLYQCPGNYNVSLGYQSLSSASVAAAQKNVSIGYQSMLRNINGYSNISVGTNAMTENTTPIQCIAIGQAALSGVASSVGGWGNIAVGYESMGNSNFSSNDIGNNIGIGNWTLTKLDDGQDNIAIGTNAMENCTSGSYNLGIGFEALQGATSSNNVAVGYRSLDQVTSGVNNIGLGALTLGGYYRTVANTIQTVTASGSTALGHGAMWNALSAKYNVCVGTLAGSGITSEQHNVVIHPVEYDKAGGSNPDYAPSNTIAVLSNAFFRAATNTTMSESVLIANGINLNSCTSITGSVIIGHGIDENTFTELNPVSPYNIDDMLIISTDADKLILGNFDKGVVHINSVLKLTPLSDAQEPTEDEWGNTDGASLKGMIYMNSTSNKLKVHNGTGWETITSS